MKKWHLNAKNVIFCFLNFTIFFPKNGKISFFNFQKIRLNGQKMLNAWKKCRNEHEFYKGKKCIFLAKNIV